MCGYCTEIYALAALRLDQPFAQAMAKITRSIVRLPMLQEVRDCGALFDGSEKPPSRSESIVWLGRAMQILMHDGFDTHAYQLLLEAPRFSSAVHLYCGGTHAETYGDGGPPLDVTTMQWLGERETWLDSGVFARRANEVAIDRCETLLAQYVASCFRAADQSEDGAVSDPATGMTDSGIELSDQFDNWLLPLMLAVAKIAAPSCPDQTMRRALLPLVKNEPGWTPQFQAFELWLQRQAAVALYDRFGIAPFAENLYWLRQELLQYLALTGRVDAGERERLLAAFLQHGTRGDGNFFSLHHWLVEGDLLQSLTSFAQ